MTIWAITMTVSPDNALIICFCLAIVELIEISFLTLNFAHYRYHFFSFMIFRRGGIIAQRRYQHAINIDLILDQCLAFLPRPSEIITCYFLIIEARLY